MTTWPSILCWKVNGPPYFFGYFCLASTSHCELADCCAHPASISCRRMERRGRHVSLRALMPRVRACTRHDAPEIERWVLCHDSLSTLLQVSGSAAGALAKMNNTLLANHVMAPHTSDEKALRLLDATEMGACATALAANAGRAACGK